MRGRNGDWFLTLIRALPFGGCATGSASVFCSNTRRSTGTGKASGARLFWRYETVVAIAVVFALHVNGASAEPPPLDWPRWRGPSGMALAPDAAWPNSWPAEPRVVWETPLGEGWSSPIVARGLVIATDRQAAKERAVAFDAATGQPRWAVEHPVDFDPHPVGRRHGNGPKSTPVIVGDRVFSLGIAGWFECCELSTGKSLWQINFPAAYGHRQPLADQRAFVDREEAVIVPIGSGQGAPVPLFGYTGSLTATDTLVVSSVGGERAGTIQAFDQATGQVVWRALTENVSYSSPVVATIAGVPQVVAMTGPRVVGLALNDGRLLWDYPFQIQYDESISTPVVTGDLVLVAGDGHPLSALQITRTGPQWSAKLVWDNIDLTSYLSSLVVHDGHIYGKNDAGQMGCARLSDGRTLWSSGQHGYYCSPIVSGNRLLGLDDRGRLHIIATDPAGYRLLGQSRVVNSQTWTMPAIVGTRLFVRGQGTLRCVEFGGQ